MIDLERDWFLEPPLDFEHKKYVLLGFLESARNDLESGKFSSFEKIGVLKGRIDSFLSGKNLDPDFYLGDFYKLGGMEKDLDPILIYSSELMRNYLESWKSSKKEIKKEIKIYDLNGEGNSSGIVVFRKMDSGQLSVYWWKKSKIFFSGREYKNIVIKEIPIKNPRYSMSYEFIFHEAMTILDIRDGNKFLFTAVEIPKKIESTPEILEIAKEKFLENLF